MATGKSRLRVRARDQGKAFRNMGDRICLIGGVFHEQAKVFLRVWPVRTKKARVLGSRLTL